MSGQPPGRWEKEVLLQLFREIDRTPATTQRTLSSRLGISLGRINFLINALIGQGFVTRENHRAASTNGPYLYRLTPQGVEEKARATHQFLAEKIREQQRLAAQIRQLRKEVQDSGAARPGRDERNAERERIEKG